jgi:nucleoside phosphorylase
VEKDLLTIVMATMIEAKPFVLGMALEEYEQKPFHLFKHDDVLLAISDIGKANAAMATAYCCQRFSPACVCNLGAAGAAGHAHHLGDTFHIDKIIEYDRPELITGKTNMHEPGVLAGFRIATLSTSDRAILDPKEREEISIHADLIDMEGASVAQACRIFDVKCYIFKYVSDTPEHTEDLDVIKNIRRYRKPFYEFFRHSIMPVIQKRQT